MDDLDNQIRKSYTEAEKAIKVDPDEAYERFMSKLNKQENEKRSWWEMFISKHYRGLITVSLIVAFILGNIFTGSVTAVGSKLKEYWYLTTTGFQRNINVNNDTPLYETKQEEFKDIATLKDRVSFVIHDLGFVPAEAKLYKIFLQQSGNSQKVTIQYRGENKSISFSQWLLTGESSTFTNIDSSNSQVKKFDYKNKEYDIVVFKNGTISCTYVELQRVTSLKTDGISYEEFTQILTNIR